MIEVVGLNRIGKDEWCALVATSHVATWFQTPEAFEFFSSLSFIEPFGCAVITNGRLKGVALGCIQKDGHALKRYLSRRAVLFGGLLLSDDITTEALKSLLFGIRGNLRGKAIYVEIRNFNDYGRWRKTFEECGFSYEPHYNVLVDTASTETVNGKLDRNRRRNIKKAMGNGVTIDANPTEADLRRYYAMLETLYHTKVKTPLYPFEFFEKLRQLPDSRFFMVKSPEGELIGGLTCVCLKGRSIYAWMACGDDQRHRELSPSVMANYAGICYAAENGFPQFDFMGAGKPDDGGYGVRDFKLKFGGELVEQGRYVCVCNPLLYRIGKLGVKLMKRL